MPFPVRSRALTGLVALTICLNALLALASAESTATRSADGKGIESAEVERRRRAGEWIVRVDGWAVRVDGVIGTIPRREGSAVDPAQVGRSLPRSPYDGLIIGEATAAGIDWRLVMALIQEESGFEADGRSEAGAYGLMQVREVAARDVGETVFEAPQDNLRTGIRYLKRLEEMFRAAEGRDRLALMLAAYNMGPSHVQDAQTLAVRFGYDPNRWYGSMQAMLPLLELPVIYERLPHGFAQGRSVVAYVERVLDWLDAYRAALRPPARAASS
jgi:hypothetical protein